MRIAALILAIGISAPTAVGQGSAGGAQQVVLGKKCKGKGKGRGKGKEKCKPNRPGRPGPAPGTGEPAPEGGEAQAQGPAELEPVGFRPLTSAEAAARVERNGFEPRPENAEENARVATAEELAEFHARSDMPYQSHVDGQFTGTTDEIIQWAAHKWGLPEDAMRAAAVVESWWDMDTLGDNGDSFGIFQMRRPYHCCLPVMRDSTAFNADYYGGIIRAYFDGKQDWLNNPDVAPDNGARYQPGDLWGSVGAWFDGRWHTPGNEAYVAKIKHRLEERTWVTDPWFASHRR